MEINQITENFNVLLLKMELNAIVDKNLCVTPCLLCGSLCNKKKLHRVTRRRH